MKISDLETLFDYTYWAKDKVLETLQQVDEHYLSESFNLSHQTIMGVLTHILNAEILWRRRCQENVSLSSMRFEHPLENIEALKIEWAQEQAMMGSFLQELSDKDLEKTISYHSLSGDTYSNTQWHILMSLVTHGNHHRSEVMGILRQLGHSTGNLDFIIYLLMQDAA